MEIIVAKRAGFCYGVKRAVDTVRRLLAENKSGKTQIYTLGKLIHNPGIVAELEELGVRAISEDMIDALAESALPERPVKLVTRAHGITKEITQKLRALSEKYPHFSFEDCTCPSVKRIHRLVAEHPGAVTVIIGDECHPEVIGIRSFADGPVFVFASAEALEQAADMLRSLPEAEENGAIMVAQTTHLLKDYKISKKIIKKVYTKVKIFDTICRVTENRQAEADELSKKVDLMIVVGGKNSSNTNRLYETARRNGTPTLLIENVSELREWLASPAGAGLTSPPVYKVGITAGASTPSGIIEEVKTLMTEQEKNLTAATAANAAETYDENDFAGMLEESLKTINIGETVSGTITFVSAAEVHVDLGTKFTGIIPQSEVSDDPMYDITEELKVGDEIKAVITHVSDKDGTAMLSKKRADSVLAWQKVQDAYRNDDIIEGKVTEVIKGGVLFDVGATRVFVPASQTGVRRGDDLSVLVGTKQRARIIELDERRRRAVASIAVVKREERKALEEQFWATVEVGKKYTGQVKSLTSYGAFVDLGGVDGMVHTSELSWTRIKDPSEVVSVGDVIDVYVKDFDPERKRVSLTYKTEENNPWRIFTSKYEIGDTAEVKIVSLTSFGAFAELVPGVDGLIHISQLADHRVNTPADAVSVGDVVNVKIIDIDYENQKISLSIRALLEEQALGEDQYEQAEQDETQPFYSTDSPSDIEIGDDSDN